MQRSVSYTSLKNKPLFYPIMSSIVLLLGGNLCPITQDQQGICKGQQEQEIEIALGDGKHIRIKNKQDVIEGHTIHAQQEPIIMHSPPVNTDDQDTQPSPSPDSHRPFLGSTSWLTTFEHHAPDKFSIVVTSIGLWACLRAWYSHAYWYLNHARRPYAWCKTVAGATTVAGIHPEISQLLRATLARTYPHISLSAAIASCMQELQRDERFINRIKNYHSCVTACMLFMPFTCLQKAFTCIVPWSTDFAQLINESEHAIACTRIYLQELLMAESV